MSDTPGRRDGPWRLIDAIVSVASADLTLSGVLGRVVEVAREMVDAQYAALGVISDDGALQEFVHTGMDAETVERIGQLPTGHGILGLLISEPRALRLDDLSRHPASVGFPEHHPPMDSFLGVPIVLDGAVYGNLYLTNRQGGDGFTDDDVELVTTLAGVAAAAINHARLHAVALQRQRWLEAKRDLTKELLSGKPRDDLHRVITTRLRWLTDAATCTLAILDGDVLTIVDADGRADDRLRGQQLCREGSLSAQALDERQAVAFDDISTVDLSLQPALPVGGYGPAMIVPLRVQGNGLGTLAAFRDKAGRSFTGTDLEAAEAFGALVSLALDYDQAQSERRRTAVLADRERISHDMHDLVIQRLFAAGLGLAAVASRITDADALERMDAAVDEIDAAIADLRSSIFALARRRRAQSSLQHQLHDLCRSVEPTLGFAPECTVDPAIDTVVPDEMVPDLLAVVREALTNIGRHAQAGRADVELRIVDATVHLSIADDGGGMRSTSRRSGLDNLAARAERLGGSMDIGASDAGGTRLQWRAPLL